MSGFKEGKEKVLIIGSGIGGLSTGIILAKLGFQVSVIEKNQQSGGMVRGYIRRGVQCSVGLHYLGALDQGQVLRRCFDFLGITDRLPLIRMGVDGPVDRYLFPDRSFGIESFDMPAGFEAYESALKTAFPDQRKQVDALMALLRRSADQFDRLPFLYSEHMSEDWFDQTAPLGTIFKQIGCSPGLQAVFGLPSILIGVPPAICPQFYHTMTLASYLMSSWRLKGSGTALAEACAQRLIALGGNLRTGEAVAHIRAGDGQVRGVTLDSGEILEASIVISTIHPKGMIELLNPEVIKPSYRRRIAGLKDTPGMMAVHALVPADRHPALLHNVNLVQSSPDGSLEDLIFMQLRPSDLPGQNLLTLITSGHNAVWDDWKLTRTGRRGPGYIQKKRELAQELIKRTENSVGPFHGLQILDVFTPLTIRDWVNSPEGSAYGVMRSSGQLLSASLLNRTSLRGLFLAGQSVLSPGILGTTLGSFTTVKSIVGPKRFLQEVRI
ncbi:MAG TPA: NAD(P)/FAD-dependent oxidoreductase [Thermodesulfobacteriota bacterium]|nr:NAD(P)/FAD-dependent oxidoreductase [Thermodesulfobacteriota bacterium]